MNTKTKNNPSVRLNFRVALISLIAIVVAGPHVYVWNQKAKSFLSESMLTQARQAIESASSNGATRTPNDATENDRNEIAADAKAMTVAVRQVQYFLTLHPDHAEAKVLLAKSFDRSSAGTLNPTANIQLHVDAMAASETSRRELLSRIAVLFNEAGRFAEGRQAAEELVLQHESEVQQADEMTDETEKRFVARSYESLATAIAGEVRTSPDKSLVKPLVGNHSAGTMFEKAIELNPNNVQLPCYLAGLYRSPEDRKMLSSDQRQAFALTNSTDEAAARIADEIVDEMIARNSDDAQAFLARYMYKSFYKIDSASEDLLSALKIDADNPQLNLLLGKQKLDQAIKSVGNTQINSENDVATALLSEAKSHFESSIQAAPENVETYYHLGEVHEKMGEDQLAINVWSTGLEKSTFKDPATFQRLTAALIRSDSGENLERANSLLDQMAVLTKEMARKAGIDQNSLRQWTQSQKFLTALIQYRQKDFGKAIASLETITRDEAFKESKTNELSHQLLTEIYLALGRPTDAAAHLETLDRATGLPQSVGIANIGEIYLNAENFPKAVAMLTRAANQSNAAEDWRLLARAIYFQQLKEPVQYRQWSAFDRTIEKARSVEHESESWKTTFLATLSEIYRVQTPTVAELAPQINTLRGLALKSPDVSKQLAVVYNQLGDFENADKWLDQHMATDLPPTKLAIVKAQLLTQRSNFQHAIEVLELASKAELDKDDAKELSIARANTLLRSGNTDSGFEILKNLVQSNPHDGRLLFDLLELAFRSGKIEPTPADWESAISKFEAENGRYSTILSSLRLSQQAVEAKTVAEKLRLLDLAHRQLSEIDDLAKHWSLLNILRGDLYFAQYELATFNNEEDSKRIAELVEQTKLRYVRAVSLGERDARMLLRLSFLESDRTASKKWADLIDSRYQNVNLLGAKLQLAYRQSNIEEARRLGETYTQRSPENPVGWIQRAFLEWTLKNHDQAEQYVSKGESLLEKSDSLSLSTWQSLFNFRINASATAKTIEQSELQIKHAQRLIEKIVSLSPEGERLLREAQLLAATESPSAGDKFLLAEKQDPENAKTLQLVANYFASPNNKYPDALDHAVRILESLSKLDSQNQRYRSTLSTLLARRGLESDWVRIKSLFKGGEKRTMGDARVLAILLLQKNNVTNSERLTDLQTADQLIRSQLTSDGSDVASGTINASAQTGDLMLLGVINDEWAQIAKQESEKQLRTQQATQIFQQVRQSPNVSLQQLYKIGLFHLRTNNIAAAEKLTSRIETAAKSSGELSPFAVALHAKLIAIQQPERKAELVAHRIESVMHEVEKDTDLSQREKIGWYLSVAKICDQSQLHGLGVKWYRKAANEDPDLMAGLVNALLVDGEFLQAMGVLTEKYQSAPNNRKPLYVAGIANVLIHARALSNADSPTNDSLYEIALPILEQAKSSFPDNLSVLVSLANIQLVAIGDVKTAIDIYRTARQLAPRNSMILNNLATVLSDDSTQLEEALRTIDEAIRLEGSRPYLLDTKAVILRKLDRLDESEKFLVNIVHSEADSRYWWHLAEVHLQRFQTNQDANQISLARRFLQTAIENGLEDSILTPGEKTRLLKLKTELGESEVAIAANPQKIEHKSLKVSTNIDSGNE